MSLGCTGPYAKEFRTAAGDSLQNGIQGILTGIVDGVFAVYETDDPSAASTTG